MASAGELGLCLGLELRLGIWKEHKVRLSIGIKLWVGDTVRVGLALKLGPRTDSRNFLVAYE